MSYSNILESFFAKYNKKIPTGNIKRLDNQAAKKGDIKASLAHFKPKIFNT